MNVVAPLVSLLLFMEPDHLQQTCLQAEVKGLETRFDVFCDLRRKR